MADEEVTVSQITGILCQVWLSRLDARGPRPIDGGARLITSNVDNAGTDGDVFLGLGRREFRLDSKEDDYERGSWREYVTGEGGWSSSGASLR